MLNLMEQFDRFVNYIGKKFSAAYTHKQLRLSPTAKPLTVATDTRSSRPKQTLGIVGAVLAVLFALTYLGSTKVYTVTYTVTGLSDADRKSAGATEEMILRDPESAIVTLKNASGGSEQLTVALPWTM